MKFVLVIFILINFNCKNSEDNSPCSPTSKTFWALVLANISTKSNSSVCNIKLPSQNTASITNNPGTTAPITQIPTTTSTPAPILTPTPVVTPPVTPPPVVFPTPKYQWKFNADYTSSTANVLTLTPSSTVLDTGIKKEGSHALFMNPGSGAHSSAQIRAISPSAIDVGNTFSVSVWLYPVSPHLSYSQKLLTVIANKTGSNGESTGFSVFLNQFNNDNREIQLNTGNGLTPPAGERNLRTAPGVFNYNTWFHLVVTYDKVNGIGRIYKDGVELAVTPNNTIHTDFSSIVGNLRIGALSTANNFCYSGNMDDFRFYDVVLTPAQVTAIFNEVL